MNVSAQEKKIRDIMVAVEHFPAISFDCLIKEAICMIKREWKKKNISDCGMLLVINEGRNWVGVIDRKMILRSICSHSVNSTYCQGWNVDQYSGPVFWPVLFSERCRLTLVRRVEELMYPRDDVVIGADSTLMEAVHLMTEGEVESLVVVENDEPVGLVRVADIFNEIHMCEFSPE
ncbi:CBS domain-containing protein [Desulfolucanica intricata]|uniref:CBS domain-containing protein n=1 Tax=Desulfolucanica intricata TaxID=1285191 RepID=UPI0008363861|nr:CBS domain-containing protein [Desulfolucanica intricata]